jgi:hypothetical protein
VLLVGAGIAVLAVRDGPQEQSFMRACPRGYSKRAYDTRSIDWDCGVCVERYFGCEYVLPPNRRFIVPQGPDSCTGEGYEIDFAAEPTNPDGRCVCHPKYKDCRWTGARFSEARPKLCPHGMHAPDDGRDTCVADITYTSGGFDWATGEWREATTPNCPDVGYEGFGSTTGCTATCRDGFENCGWDPAEQAYRPSAIVECPSSFYDAQTFTGYAPNAEHPVCGCAPDFIGCRFVSTRPTVEDGVGSRGAWAMPVSGRQVVPAPPAGDALGVNAVAVTADGRHKFFAGWYAAAGAPRSMALWHAVDDGDAARVNLAAMRFEAGFGPGPGELRTVSILENSAQFTGFPPDTLFLAAGGDHGALLRMFLPDMTREAPLTDDDLGGSNTSFDRVTRPGLGLNLHLSSYEANKDGDDVVSRDNDVTVRSIYMYPDGDEFILLVAGSVTDFVVPEVDPDTQANRWGPREPFDKGPRAVVLSIRNGNPIEDALSTPWTNTPPKLQQEGLAAPPAPFSVDYVYANRVDGTLFAVCSGASGGTPAHMRIDVPVAEQLASYTPGLPPHQVRRDGAAPPSKYLSIPGSTEEIAVAQTGVFATALGPTYEPPQMVEVLDLEAFQLGPTRMEQDPGNGFAVHQFGAGLVSDADPDADPPTRNWWRRNFTPARIRDIAVTPPDASGGYDAILATAAGEVMTVRGPLASARPRWPYLARNVCQRQISPYALPLGESPDRRGPGFFGLGVSGDVARARTYDVDGCFRFRGEFFTNLPPVADGPEIVVVDDQGMVLLEGRTITAIPNTRFTPYCEVFITVDVKHGEDFDISTRAFELIEAADYDRTSGPGGELQIAGRTYRDYDFTLVTVDEADSAVDLPATVLMAHTPGGAVITCTTPTADAPCDPPNRARLRVWGEAIHTDGTLLQAGMKPGEIVLFRYQGMFVEATFDTGTGSGPLVWFPQLQGEPEQTAGTLTLRLNRPAALLPRFDPVGEIPFTFADVLTQLPPCASTYDPVLAQQNSAEPIFLGGRQYGDWVLQTLLTNGRADVFEPLVLHQPVFDPIVLGADTVGMLRLWFWNVAGVLVGKLEQRVRVSRTDSSQVFPSILGSDGKSIEPYDVLVAPGAPVRLWGDVTVGEPRITLTGPGMVQNAEPGSQNTIAYVTLSPRSPLDEVVAFREWDRAVNVDSIRPYQPGGIQVYSPGDVNDNDTPQEYPFGDPTAFIVQPGDPWQPKRWLPQSQQQVSPNSVAVVDVRLEPFDATEVFNLQTNQNPAPSAQNPDPVPQEIVLSWDPVLNATRYDVYWGFASEVELPLRFSPGTQSMRLYRQFGPTPVFGTRQFVLTRPDFQTLTTSGEVYEATAECTEWSDDGTQCLSRLDSLAEGFVLEAGVQFLIVPRGPLGAYPMMRATHILPAAAGGNDVVWR